ncbi:glycosyltransferase [Salinisphaera sp. USBA-960]|nr:glycosyltransferase [Salifodinibacter halophilus]NNC27008.1 glycosyltransferase [Salifodinibacter halophilus]
MTSSQSVSNAPPLHVAIFIPSFGDGGVERGVVHTARGLTDLGVRVDFITAHSDQPYLSELSTHVALIEIGGDATDQTSYRWFVDYLKNTPPDVVLSAKDRAHATAVAARDQTGVATRIVMRASTVVSRRHRATRFWRRMAEYREMRRILPRADLMIAVSRGVAEDTAQIAGVPEARIRAIPSPIITPELTEFASQPVTHPWLVDKTCPVVLAGGGLRRQKGFDDLLRAVAIARRTQALRLIVVGTGRLRRRLERLAAKLGISEHVDFMGFVANPYPLIAAADLFALSSRWEGAPTIVTEAVALGRKVVATRCGSGPGEILADNPYARIVPVGVPKQFAAAVTEALAWPTPPHDMLRQSVRDYTLEVSAERYRDVLSALVATT